MVNKRNKQLRKTFGWIFLTFGIILFFLHVFYTSSLLDDYEIRDTDCYDRYRNKIEGLICEEKYYQDGDPITNLIVGCFGLSIIFAIAIILLSYDSYGGI